jgi:hypothetical protein
MPETAPSPRRTAALALLAALVHLAFDAACSSARWARPPHLRLEDMPEAFRSLPLVDSATAVSVAFSAVGGVLAALGLHAVAPGPRRFRALAAFLGGLWLLSEALTWLTWLSTPLPGALPGLLLGVPRGLALAWLLERLSRREGEHGAGSPSP